MEDRLDRPGVCSQPQREVVGSDGFTDRVFRQVPPFGIRAEIVADGDRPEALAGQFRDKVGTDEPGAAGNEKHARNPMALPHARHGVLYGEPATTATGLHHGVDGDGGAGELGRSPAG